MKKLTYLLLIPMLLPVTTFADKAAVDLLNKMNQALHELNYTGTLAYLQGNSLSTLHIDHSVVNGVEGERVVRLNEAGSELSRELKGFSLSSIPRIRPEMEKVYSFDMGRENRVANIPCRIITARPKDRQRYLQKYCIDTVSGMLLDYMLVGKSHKPVEQFMFTTIEIRVPESMAATNSSICAAGDCALQSLNANTGTTTAILDHSITTVDPIQNSITKKPSKIISKQVLRQVSHTSLEDGWVIETVPLGYEIKQAPHLKEQNNNGDTRHYVLSDGLSTVSVFVTPYLGNTPMEAVEINSGALNVVTQQKGKHRITAVGEVPEITLKNLVKNLRKK
ncbi:MucB/RseB C-terminal domain-containing protein [Cocleimonas sp. KMM 6892]|uniref:MucB/RseB C-terminal domain-containing protein n=1 Tax=unclassified Cocleimonas TaxID=2639732 RepID=UPI002DB80889|nr:MULTISPECIES: MucB/RseB C-terminal domain-containing protein [unclassified Cocleimonas]MEB8433904.1 MucB/RseB C-terminal domain-containing protein [Cocleimonas sp. KMM 6892]MEC4716715.1 MucB/RseB C-terminal domain-containing protein [Cocleimonas sp. KMM 6895]MEC4746130.1 MucB/RseB C-terminal domain-containing protein [Cocleimonas sp. KMM 6896]